MMNESDFYTLDSDTETDTILEEIPKGAEVSTSQEGTRIDAYRSHGNSLYSVAFYELEREEHMRNKLGIAPELTIAIPGIPFNETENKFRSKAQYKIGLRSRKDEVEYIVDIFEFYQKRLVGDIIEEIKKEFMS